MKQFTLSDHTADQGRAAAEKRQARYDAQCQDYKKIIAAHKAKADMLRDKTQVAFNDRQYFSWLASWLPRIIHTLSFVPKKPALTEAGRDEIVWNAGNEGEQRVTNVLMEQMSDEWVAIDGYKNSGGEIDKILVGPKGIIALEVKFLNGEVFCDGDRWWRDKYDKYGNLVEMAVKIRDKGGRTPSLQVNMAADRLQKFLKKRVPVTRVARGVVLSHHSSRIGSIENPTVDFVITLHELDMKSIINSLPPIPFDLDVAKVTGLIRKDNDYYKQPADRRINNRQ